MVGSASFGSAPFGAAFLPGREPEQRATRLRVRLKAQVEPSDPLDRAFGGRDDEAQFAFVLRATYTGGVS